MTPDQLLGLIKELGGKNVHNSAIFSRAYQIGFHPSEVYAIMEGLVKCGKIKRTHRGPRYGAKRHLVSLRESSKETVKHTPLS